MLVNAYSERFESLFECFRSGLRGKLGYYDASDVKSYSAESVYKTERVKVVCYAEISAQLVFFYVVCRDDKDYFGAVAQFFEHAELAVRHKSRKNAGRVIVVEKFTAEFEIQLSAERIYPFKYFLRLKRYIFVIVKSCFFHVLIPLVFCGKLIFAVFYFY